MKDLAWKCLLSTGKAAEPYLVKYLQDQDAAIRKDALMGLRGSQDEQTLAAVAKQFEQETEGAALHQAFELGEDVVGQGLAVARPLTTHVEARERPRERTGRLPVRDHRSGDLVDGDFVGKLDLHFIGYTLNDFQIGFGIDGGGVFAQTYQLR